MYDRDLRAFRNSFWNVSVTRGEVAEGKRKPQSVLHEMNFKWEVKQRKKISLIWKNNKRRHAQSETANWNLATYCSRAKVDRSCVFTVWKMLWDKFKCFWRLILARSSSASLLLSLSVHTLCWRCGCDTMFGKLHISIFLTLKKGSNFIKK